MSRFVYPPSCLCDVGPTLRDPLGFGAPFVFVSFCCHGFFERHVWFVPLNIFACFCNISFVFCVFMHLCVYALRVAFVPCVAPCMVHGIGMHVMHHIIIIMFIMMFIMFIMLIIIMFIIMFIMFIMFVDH